MASRRARIAAWAALGLLGLTGIAASIAWWQRCALAEWLALRELRARGVVAALRVVRLDSRGGEIADLRLGAANAPDLTLSRGSLAWSRESLRARRLDRIALRGLRARARIDERGLHLGALDALLAGGSSAASGPLALPFLEARLDDAQALIDSPQGALRIRAEGSARPEGEIVRAELTLHGESPEGALDFGGGGTLNLASQEIAAVGTLAGVTPWARADGLIRAQGTLASVRAEFSGSALPDARALPVRASAPIRVSGDVTRASDGTLAARAKFSAGELAYEQLASLGALSGDLALRRGTGGFSGEATFTAAGVKIAGAGSAASVEGVATLAGAQLDVTAKLRGIELPDLARAEAATLSGSYALDGGVLHARIEAPQALATGIAQLGGVVAELRYAAGALSGGVRVAKLVELSKPALIAPLRVAAKLSGSRSRVAIAGKAFTPGDGLVFDFDGGLELSHGQLDLKIALPETDLSAQARQPGRVFPWLADVISAMRGKLGGEAAAAYANGSLAASGVIALHGADVVTAWGTIRGLMGVVTVTAIDPLETPPGQTVWMQSVDAGLPLGNGSLKFRLRPEGVLEVERGEWGFAGGKLVFSGAVPLDARERRLRLQVEGVSLETLLAALDFEGLSGTGVLGGSAPLVQRGNALRVENGDLHATQMGVIRFKSGAGGAALAGKQPALAPLLGALDDLHYDELTLRMNGDLSENPSDKVAVELHIRGRNPNFQKGHLVALNVNVELPFGSLLKGAEVATSVPAEIEERVREALGKEKP